MQPKDFFNPGAHYVDATTGNVLPQFGPFWCDQVGPKFTELGGGGQIPLALAGTVAVKNAQTAVTGDFTVAAGQNILDAAVGIPASVLNVATKGIYFYASGVWTTNGTWTPTMRVTATLAGATNVVLTISGAATTAAQTNAPWFFYGTLSTVGLDASATQETHGGLGYPTATVTAAVAEFLDQNTAAQTLGDLSASGNTANLVNFQLNLKVVNGTNTTDSVTVRQAFFELIN